MSLILRVNEWLNDNAPFMKRAIRAVISKKMRASFAERKFSATIDHHRYDVIFNNIYARNWWGSTESVSGCGSERRRTEAIRKGLIGWCASNGIRTMFDAPCGDFNWMGDVVRTVDLSYLGGDIVPELVRKSAERGERNCRFIPFDILADELPEVDAWLCRDELFHFPNSAIQNVLERFHGSNIRYFLSSHFENTTTHPDIEFGRYRPVNLCCPPFNWPRPTFLIFDGGDEDADRYIAVWENRKYGGSPARQSD